MICAGTTHKDPGTNVPVSIFDELEQLFVRQAALKHRQKSHRPSEFRAF